MPTNIDPASATVITSLPYNITISADDVNSVPGTEHTMWWVYTNTQYSYVGFYAFGTPVNVIYPLTKTVFVPEVSLWEGTPPSLTPYPPSAIDVTGQPVQVPYLAFPQTVYFKVEVQNDPYLPGSLQPKNPVSDPLIIQAYAGPLYTAPAGSLLIPDFNESFPSVLIGTNQQIVQSNPLAACDFGAILDDGTIGIIDGDSNVRIYGPGGALLYTQAGLSTHTTFQQIQGDGVNTFYVGDSTTAVAATIKTISSGGVVGGTTWTLPANSKSLRGMAPNRAETILYYSSFNIGVNGNNIRRYDISGAGAAMTDLVGDIGGGYVPSKDLFVMKDGSILVTYRASSVDAKTVRYDTSGAVLNTYTVPSGFGYDRTALGTDDPGSFWWWTFDNTVGSSSARFYNINVGTGAVITQFDVPVFTDGIYQVDSRSDNPPRFGISNSCPLLVIRQEFLGAQGDSAGSGEIPDYATRTIIPRRQRTAPHLSREQLLNFYHVFQLDLEAGQGLTTGQGDDPTIMLQWSDDGGHTWSNEHWVQCSPLGTYRSRAMWRRLGQSRDRVFRVTVSDPVAWRLLQAFIDVSAGVS